MNPGREQIILHTSTAFKDALGTYAGNRKMSMADVIRKATADLIGYDLTQEPPRTRTPKYASPEEAAKALSLRQSLTHWANSTASKLMASGNILDAGIIARAVVAKDYDSLKLLREVMAPTKPETTEGAVDDEND